MIKILVVEDDINLNKIVCSYLNDSGFEAHGCLNASSAYDAMYNNMYDLNRQLIDEDKNIIVIKQSNIVESIQKFENVKGSVTYKQLDLSSFLS